jgi:hypothetical protein
VIQTNQSGIAFGAAAVCLVLGGGWAAAYAQSVSSHPSNATLTVPLPPALPVTGSPQVGTEEPDFIDPAVIERITQRVRAKALASKISNRGGSDGSEATNFSALSEPTTSGAKLPLPDRIVVRTIERIGYPCGSVASTVAMAGEQSGVFKVRCASGHSYRATPVNGLYHFRRL